MKKSVKIIVVSVVIILIFISAYYFYQFVSNTSSLSTEETKQSTYSAKNNLEVKEYARDHYDVEVFIVENRGTPSIDNPGGVTVRTTDEDEVTFEMYVGYSGKIKGDNYEEMKSVSLLNDAFHASEDYLDLVDLGVVDAELRRTESTSHQSKDLSLTFYINLSRDQEDEEFISIENYDVIISVANKWRKEAKEQYDLIYDELVVSQVNQYKGEPVSSNIVLDLTTEYDATDKLANELAKQNPAVFSLYLLENMWDEISLSEEDLKGIIFYDHQFGHPLACEEMEIVEECATVSLTVQHKDGEEVNSKEDFRYDDKAVKETLFQAIQQINELDVEIDEIILKHLYKPDNLAENQFYTEEELEEKEDYKSPFYTGDAVIKDIKDISTMEDIYFEDK